jgi:hypothetical protein
MIHGPYTGYVEDCIKANEVNSSNNLRAGRNSFVE